MVYSLFFIITHSGVRMSIFPNKYQQNQKMFSALFVALALLILLLDWNSPLGVASGVLYVGLVLIGLLSGRRQMILNGAATGTILCLLGLVLSPAGGELGKVLLNRFLAILTIWITALLCLLQHRTQERLKQAHNVLETHVAERTQELKEAHQTLVREKLYLELNKNLTATANISRSVEESMQYSLDLLCQHTGWPIGHVYLVEGVHGRKLVSSQIWHRNDPERFAALKEITESTEFEPGIGLPGRVMESGKPAWITDVTRDENFPRARLVNNIGIRAALAFPILIGQEVAGIMEFFSSEALPPQPELLDVMAQAGMHLGRVMERHRAEKHRDKLLGILRERIKELTCLYQVAQIISTGKPLEQMFLIVEEPIARGWQFPEHTRARILFDGEKYETAPFKETPWKLAAPILVHGQKHGALEIYYTREKPEAQEGPFLKEERHLIDSLAHLLGLAAEQKLAEESMQKSEAQLRNLYQRLQKVREEERTRIAREFHDELGQLLTTLRLELEVLDKKLNRVNPECQDNTKRLLELVEGTLPAVKQLIMDLRPPVLDDLGLEEAIRWQARDFEKRTGIHCQVDVDMETENLDQDLATALFRIFQETLTNVTRHADANEVHVHLEEKEGNLILDVTDNGKGIEQWKVTDSKSLGLLGIRERVLPWGGEVAIQGLQQAGTSVTIRIQMEKM